MRRHEVAVLCMLGGVLLGCEDPPGDGFLSVEFLVDNTDNTDVEAIELEVDRVEVVHSAAADGEEVRLTVDEEPPPLRLQWSNGQALARFAYAVGVRPGFVHQVRFISPTATIVVDGTTHPLVVPSGPQTGFKVSAPEGEPFAITTDVITRVVVRFPLSDQLRRPPGRGFLLSPEREGALSAAGPAVLPASWIRPGQVLVAFKEGTDVEAAVTDEGGVIVRRSALGRPWVTVEKAGDEFATARLFEARDDVVMAAPNYLLTTNATTPEFTQHPILTQHMSTIHATDAWDVQRGSRSVPIAVIDDVMSPFHHELRENILFNAAEIPAEQTLGPGCFPLGSPVALPENPRLDPGPDGVVTLADFQTEEWRTFFEDGGVDLGEERIVRLGLLVGQFENECGVLENRVSDDGNLMIDDLLGWNFASRDATDPNDIGSKDLTDGRRGEAFSHGNSVAGLVAATSESETMYGEDRTRAGYVGVAWQAGLILIRGVGSLEVDPDTGEILNVAVAVDSYLDSLAYAVERGAVAVNLSASVICVSEELDLDDDVRARIGCRDEEEAFKEDWNRFVELANAEEVLLVLAPKNEFFDLDDDRVTDMPTEGDFLNKLVVTRTDAFGEFINDPEQQTPFGDETVDIAAPAADLPGLTLATSGDDVRVTQFETVTWDGLSHEPDASGSVSVDSPLLLEAGTSFAAPLVTGTAALVAAQRPDLFLDERNPIGLKQVILAGATMRESLTGKVRGSRLLDVDAAVRAAGSPP